MAVKAGPRSLLPYGPRAEHIENVIAVTRTWTFAENRKFDDNSHSRNTI